MVSISIILSTARDDYPVIELEKLHLFHSTIESLKLQSFKNFYDNNCKGRMFDMWVKNQPLFSLKEERKHYND